MSTSASTVLSARDLEFLLFEWLDVENLSERPRFAEHDRESYDALLALCEEIATEHFAHALPQERHRGAGRSTARRCS